MTTPIEMPIPLPVRSKTFDLVPQQLLTPVTSGFIQTIERTKPFWVAEYSTPPLRDDRYQAMQAFLDALQGAAFPFIGYDPRRIVPYAYKDLPIGATPWGTAQVNSTSTSGSALNLQFGNPTTITRGDFIQFTSNNRVHLYRATETKGPSTNMSLAVVPRPNQLTGPFTARLIRAGAAMKLIPGSVKWTDSVDSLPQVSFQAVQYIDKST